MNLCIFHRQLYIPKYKKNINKKFYLQLLFTARRSRWYALCECRVPAGRDVPPPSAASFAPAPLAAAAAAVSTAWPALAGESSARTVIDALKDVSARKDKPHAGNMSSASASSQPPTRPLQAVPSQAGECSSCLDLPAVSSLWQDERSGLCSYRETLQ